MSLGQKLKKLRTEKGLTQKDLADELHVTFQTVSKWESDTNEPDISTLKELAKFYDCTINYLLSDEDEEEEEEVEEETTPAPVEVVEKTIIVHQPELHVCARCGKDIEEDDLVSEDITKKVRQGRSTRSISVGQTFYHKDCLDQVKKERAQKKQELVSAATKRAIVKSYVISGIAGIVVLGALLPILLIGCKDFLPIYASILISIGAGYLIFSDVYCILSGTYIADIFFAVAKWSIRFPGIIFSLDLGGLFFLIAMKAIFAALGFLFGIFTFVLATALSSGLAAVSFPFVVIKNHAEHYQGSIFYQE